MEINMEIMVYLLFINFMAFFLFGLDKSKAKRRKYRIPEKVLMMSAVLGGSVGAICGMEFFRHKTRHNKFRYGLPLIFLAQIIIFVLLQQK